MKRWFITVALLILAIIVELIIGAMAIGLSAYVGAEAYTEYEAAGTAYISGEVVGKSYSTLTGHTTFTVKPYELDTSPEVLKIANENKGKLVIRVVDKEFTGGIAGKDTLDDIIAIGTYNNSNNIIDAQYVDISIFKEVVGADYYEPLVYDGLSEEARAEYNIN